MSPLRESSSWTSRYKQGEDVIIKPLRRYYLIFEGAHTEVKYFEGIDDNKKSLGINNSIELVLLHKDGEIENYSSPKNLLMLVNQKKDQLKTDTKYDEEIDRFVIVFDRDSFKTADDYLEYINLATQGNILAVTNPCFELWLLLHFNNSVEDHIKYNSDKILKNKRVSNNHTFLSDLFSKVSGMNSKSNLKFEKLKDSVDNAISQEKLLTQEIELISKEIGSNIGVLLEELRKDPRDSILNILE